MAKVDVAEGAKGELDELTQEIKRTIDDNRKFLERIMDDEFDEENDADVELSEEEQ